MYTNEIRKNIEGKNYFNIKYIKNTQFYIKIKFSTQTTVHLIINLEKMYKIINKTTKEKFQNGQLGKSKSH